MRRVPVRLGNRASVWLGRLHRRMHGVEREVEEERFVLAAVEERHGLAGEGVGEVFLLVGDRLAVADERIVVGVAGQVGPRTAEEPVVEIESPLVRPQPSLKPMCHLPTMPVA